MGVVLISGVKRIGLTIWPWNDNMDTAGPVKVELLESSYCDDFLDDKDGDGSVVDSVDDRHNDINKWKHPHTAKWFRVVNILYEGHTTVHENTAIFYFDIIDTSKLQHQYGETRDFSHCFNPSEIKKGMGGYIARNCGNVNFEITKDDTVEMTLSNPNKQLNTTDRGALLHLSSYNEDHTINRILGLVWDPKIPNFSPIASFVSVITKKTYP